MWSNPHGPPPGGAGNAWPPWPAIQQATFQQMPHDQGSSDVSKNQNFEVLHPKFMDTWLYFLFKKKNFTHFRHIVSNLHSVFYNIFFHCCCVNAMNERNLFCKIVN